MSNLAQDARGHIYLPESLDLTSDRTSLVYDILNRDMVGFQFTWAGLDQNDGYIRMEWSNDNVNFKPYYGSTITLSVAADTHGYDIVSTGFRYIRLAYFKGSNTSGSAVIVVTSKTRQR